VSKNYSSSPKEDCKDDKFRRQQETSAQYEDHDEVAEPADPASQRWLWVEQRGGSNHRTFIAPGERYEMVSCDADPFNIVTH